MSQQISHEKMLKWLIRIVYFHTNFKMTKLDMDLHTNF